MALETSICSINHEARSSAESGDEEGWRRRRGSIAGRKLGMRQFLSDMIQNPETGVVTPEHSPGQCSVRVCGMIDRAGDGPMVGSTGEIWAGRLFR